MPWLRLSSWRGPWPFSSSITVRCAAGFLWPSSTSLRAWDILLITTLLMVGGDGRSMLAVLYVLVIVAAPLRLSLPLVWTATLGAMAGYAFFLGYVRWRMELPIEQRLSRPQQVVFLLALGAAGLLAGQFVRQCRRLVYGSPVPVEKRCPYEPYHHLSALLLTPEFIRTDHRQDLHPVRTASRKWTMPIRKSHPGRGHRYQ